MIYEMKNCIDGSEPVYKTTVEITESDEMLRFVFDAEHSELFCCERGYNNIHSLGDACEILIGTSEKRDLYYEIEINPEGDLMIARMTNRGVDGEGKPILDIDFVSEPFIDARTEKTGNGYRAYLSFSKKSILCVRSRCESSKLRVISPISLPMRTSSLSVAPRKLFPRAK